MHCRWRLNGVFYGPPGPKCSEKPGRQASHGGELAGAVAAGAVTRADVTELGAVLAEAAAGRRDATELTLFDSTGLAIQDLAVAKAAYAKVADLNLPRLPL